MALLPSGVFPNTMPTFELARTIPTGGTHLPNFRVQADIDGDGATETIILFGDPPRLEAYRLTDGGRLWVFDSLQPAPACLACSVADWDGDGNLEILLAQGTRLMLLDAPTGTLKRQLDLPYKGVTTHIAIANLPHSGPASAAILLVQGVGIIAIDGVLRELWHVSSHGNDVGHFVFVGDTDDDGADECLFSIEREAQLVHVDHDGTLIWSKDILGDLRLDPAGLEDHVDHLAIFDINQDGREELLVATGGCCLDANGQLLWHHNERLTHGQAVCCGNFEGASQPLAVFVDAWTPTPQVVASNGSGQVEWVYNDFQHRIFSAIRLDRDGGYLIVTEQDYQEGHPLYHVHLLDGCGTCLDRFAFEDKGGVQMPHNPQAGPPPADLLWRGVHLALCDDVDGDGEQEVVIDDLGGVIRVLKVIGDPVPARM